MIKINRRMKGNKLAGRDRYGKTIVKKSTEFYKISKKQKRFKIKLMVMIEP
jgi:hypothetical protein